ncbi:hypothetical protein NC99_17590 [Sunxiuqinia dokdonensis]|uniref:Thioredoxin domain-containing protein n=2 Tax=Sunxiuqinia dokdonensis TaxID=1409788 RepID=A0A0L8VAE0_9BACT|nr:hypothetical protein NC99_17590 [Sunxiuqinia dokdonensis]
MLFLKEKQLDPDGSLRHSYKNETSKIDGFLEDYALLIQAMIDLFETTGKFIYLEDAQQLADKTFLDFFDPEKDFFYFTAITQTDLINRSIEVHDNVIPASNSVMANNLFRLGYLADQARYLKIAQTMLSKLVDDFKTYPSGYSNWLQLALNFTGNQFEVAVSGEKAISKLHDIQKHYLPNTLFCAGTDASDLPLLKGRLAAGETRIYVCQNQTCQLPVEKVADALKILQA